MRCVRLAREFVFTDHIRARGEEADAIKTEAGYKARRWVVEQTQNWMNRFRGFLRRWNQGLSDELRRRFRTVQTIDGPVR
jgi:hypothetical protein